MPLRLRLRRAFDRALRRAFDRALRRLRDRFDGYRPERCYMRGPGPKCAARALGGGGLA
jgi:hypothetical protein